MLRMFSRWFGGDSSHDESADDDRSLKWLPVIDTDSCTGCNECVDACKHGCLSMEWNFATLVHPDSCHSDGKCMEACPYGVIHMDWVQAAGDERVGLWCEPGQGDK